MSVALTLTIFAYVIANAFASIVIDCHPDRNASEAVCKARGCIWGQPSHPLGPWCQFDSSDSTKMAGYEVQHMTKIKHKSGSQTFAGFMKRRPTPTIFGGDMQQLSFTIESLTNDILRVLIVDVERNSKRVPHDHVNHFLTTVDKRNVSDSLFDIDVEKSPFGFSVTRKSTGAKVVDTKQIPGFTMAEQFLQMSIKTPTADVFGIGENSHDHMKRDFQWTKWGLFTKDTRPGYSEINLYGHHPFYLCVEDDTGNSHGVFLLNSHATQVRFQPDPNIITFTPIGGVLELYVFLGPTPDAVIEQYTSLIGRALMPPYWAMGFNLCRWGYVNLTYLEQVFDRNRAANIPQDVQFIDLDYMDGRKDFSVDPVNFQNLAAFVDKVHNQYNMKLVVIVDPAIANKPNKTYEALDIGLKMDVFVKDPRSGQPLEGVVWPGTTHWVDFTHPSSSAYWSAMHMRFHDVVDFDGIWIDMNEPSNFGNGSVTGCINNKLNYPPFNPLIYDNITEWTLCMDAQQYMGKQDSLHSLYSYTEARAMYQALQTVLPGKRPFVLSRSTFAGSGHYTNHWMGDNQSRWPQLRSSIINLLEYQMFGYPLMGADICGFAFNATEELCLRWHQLGAFYPYMRNHNDISSAIDQDPAAWAKNTTDSIRDMLMMRYTLLPFLYTLLYRAHVNGTPVARPLFFEFKTDPASQLVDDQYLWGSGMMVVPILDPYAVTRQAYFPVARWYNVSSGTEVADSAKSRNISIYIEKNAIGLFLLGGAVLPIQVPAMTTFDARQNSFGLLVALDEHGKACGGLHWDDGESEVVLSRGLHTTIEFYAFNQNDKKQGGLRISNMHNGYPIKPSLDNVEVFGMLATPKNVKIDGQPATKSQVRYDEVKKLMILSQLQFSLNSDHQITWKLFD